MTRRSGMRRTGRSNERPRALNDMEWSVKKKLIGRLLAVAMLLAAVSGTIAYHIAVKEADDLVLSLAAAESEAIMQHVSFLNAGDQAAYDAGREQAVHHLGEEHVTTERFSVIELYNRHKRKVVEVHLPGFGDLPRTIDRMTRGETLTNSVTYQKHMIGPAMYIQVFSPLVYASGEVVGYLEGIHRVAPETMLMIRRRPAIAVLLIVIIVFMTTLAVYPVVLMQNRDMARLQADLAASNIWMLEMLGNAVAKRDRDTSTHNYRVAIYAVSLAEAAGMEQNAVRDLMKGAFLHDVGKIGVSDAILHKPSPLTKQEIMAMQTHVQHGMEIIGRYAWLRGSLDVIRYHHEKYDGTGYLAGLKGGDIPLGARIFTIVDVFDALTTKRPYKEAASLEEALHAMLLERGSRFDPSLLDVFIRIAPRAYAKVALADEDKLTQDVEDLRRKYFSGAWARAGGEETVIRRR